MTTTMQRGLTWLQLTILLWLSLGYDPTEIQALWGFTDAEFDLAQAGFWLPDGPGVAEPTVTLVR
ncbi:MAG: hypothetical protein KKA73_03995 [Chloroflexi bacterium]|nr:hypothetical protein [Chloroflexota bacterium]MBU1746827.1 hypothetical protein [Chloroflexota bacterium]